MTKVTGGSIVYVTVWLMTCVHVTHSARDPAPQADVMETYRVNNRLQCQRLCWYRKTCARFAFYTKTDNPGGKGGNCLLYANSDTNQKTPLNGWIVGSVSENILDAENTCRSRPCDNATVCVPGMSPYLCVPVPPDNIPECASNPCQNNGTCVEMVNGYNCTCHCGFFGNKCENASTNLALNKPAKQSSFWYVLINKQYPPGNAVDGYKGTNPDNCTHTLNNETAASWWQVDLQCDYNIISVAITNRGDSDMLARRLRNFTITVHSHDPDTSKHVEGVVIHHYTGNFTRGETRCLPCNSSVCPARGRYLRITNTPNEFLTLCEVEVMGVAATP